MPRVVHFELSADDCSRASSFYKNVFSWDVTKWPGPLEYYLAKTGPDSEKGINGGLLQRRGNMHCVITIEVANVDDAVAKIEKHGGTIVVPKMPIPGVGYLAYFTDTEGNIVGVMHPDVSAK